MEKKRKRSLSVDEIDIPKKRGRPRKSDTTLSRYPDVEGETLDPAIARNNKDAIDRELEKDQPRKDVILPLMKALFHCRREFILNNSSSVNETISSYPALKLSYVVS